MANQTTTSWTCDRCKAEVVTTGSGEEAPHGWVDVDVYLEAGAVKEYTLCGDCSIDLSLFLANKHPFNRA